MARQGMTSGMPCSTSSKSTVQLSVCTMASLPMSCDLCILLEVSSMQEHTLVEPMEPGCPDLLG